MARASASMLANDVASSACVFSSRLAVISLNDVVRYPISSAGPRGARERRAPGGTLPTQPASPSTPGGIPPPPRPPPTQTNRDGPTNNHKENTHHHHTPS